MMLGRYAIVAGKDGKIFVPSCLSQHYNAGDTYYVILNEWAIEEEGAYLVYRFNKEVFEGEKLLKKYKVPANKCLRIPPEFREALSGECYLIGVGDGIELHNAEKFDSRMRPSLEEIDSMIKELEEALSKK